MNEKTTITLPEMCKTHESLLVHQAGYKPSDPWRALLVISQVALFQGASCDPKVYAEVGGDVMQFKRLGCLACRKPDLFGELVEAAKTHELGDIKTLGEQWIARAAT